MSRYLLLLITAASSIPGFTSNAFPYQLPECKLSKWLETPVKFYASEEILELYDHDQISKIVDSWFQFSEQALSNSCVPMKRIFSGLTYLNNVESELFSSRSIARYVLEKQLNMDLEDLFPNKIGYVGVLTASHKQLQNCGEADVSSNFFIIALDCAEFVMEHELGHLAGAGHDVQTALVSDGSLENYRYSGFPVQKEFAFGWLCGSSGTVMSYANGNNLPFYSSPEISINGQPCGNERFGNNTRVLKEYAEKHLDSLNQ